MCIRDRHIVVKVGDGVRIALVHSVIETDKDVYKRQEVICQELVNLFVRAGG